MLTSIYSLLENNKDIYLNIHIIEDNLDEINKNRLFKLEELYNNVKINLYSIKLIEDIINKFNIPKLRDTNIANARLFANEIIKDVDTIFYLDCDTLVVNPISEIFKYSKANPIFGTKEICIPEHINNYPFLAKQFYEKKHSFYSYEEVEKVIMNPHIYHNLCYQTIRPWEKNNIHPYTVLYRFYRTLWDKEYTKDECNSILAKSQLISYMNILTKSLLNDEIYTKIKKK